MDIKVRNNPNNRGRPFIEIPNVNFILSGFHSYIEGDWIAVQLTNFFLNIYYKNVKEKFHDIFTGNVSMRRPQIQEPRQNFATEGAQCLKV